MQLIRDGGLGPRDLADNESPSPPIDNFSNRRPLRKVSAFCFVSAQPYIRLENLFFSAYTSCMCFTIVFGRLGIPYLKKVCVLIFLSIADFHLSTQRFLPFLFKRLL